MFASRLSLILLLAAATVAACSGDGTTSNGALSITSTPAGAEVFVNGLPKGFTPLTVRELEPGDYEVVLRKDGYQDAQVITSVKARQTSNVVYALRSERGLSDLDTPLLSRVNDWLAQTGLRLNRRSLLLSAPGAVGGTSARGTNPTASSHAGMSRPATVTARRVFPVPPGPVRVTRRTSG